MKTNFNIPNFKSISQKTGEKSLENKIFAKGNNSINSKSNTTKLKLDLYYIKTNLYMYMKYQVNMSKDDKDMPRNEILAKGNDSCKRRLNATKVELDLYYVKTNSYIKFKSIS